MLLALLCLVLTATHASPPGAALPSALLAKARQYAGNDHARFLSVLHQLEQIAPFLSQQQQVHVAYWEAWEAQHKGDYARSTRMFLEVIDRAKDDPLMVARAKNQMVLNYMVMRHYVKAFTLANALIDNLDKISDPNVRNRILENANDILLWQKQYDLAMKFAEQMKASATTAQAKCQADYAMTDTLLQRGGVLTSSSPQFQQTVDQCLAANMLSTANTIRLDWASLMDDEGHTQQALAFLDRIAPDIVKNGFQAHMASLYVTRAQAYLIEKKYGLARKWAQETLSATPPHGFTWSRQAAYEVLYQAQEHMGQYAAALASYKNYVAQYKKSMSDTKAQALAYQVVQQGVLAKRLKLEELGKQNRILQLRQSLDRKSAETSRLHILLLMMVLAFIAYWSFRTKHSQLRFRKLARHDDLTGAFNRQHFFDRCEQTLERLEKTGGHACLLILDLDHFKRINDEHGHFSGDAVLKQVARCCMKELHKAGVFGRLGGEEFIALLPGCTSTEGMEIGERIRNALALTPVQLRDDITVTVTTSIGLASTETAGHGLKSLLIAADQALYAAKHGGRNRLVILSNQPERVTH